jgi:hypothetical protein
MQPTLLAVGSDQLLSSRSAYTLHTVITAAQKYGADSIYTKMQPTIQVFNLHTAPLKHQNDTIFDSILLQKENRDGQIDSEYDKGGKETADCTESPARESAWSSVIGP